MMTADPDMRLLQADEAEGALVVTALINYRNVAVEIIEMVNSSYFFNWIFKTIIQAIELIVRRKDQKETVSLVSVNALLRQQGNLEKIGGATALTTMLDTIPGADGNIPHAIKIVKEAFQRREMYAHCNDLRHAVLTEPDHDSLLNKYQQALVAVDGYGRSGSSITVKELAYTQPEEWDRRKDKGLISGVSTGLTRLDGITGGFQDGDLVTLAARPAMGKTGLSGGLAEGAARAGHPVQIFSLEMTAGQLFDRMAAKVAKIDLQKFRLGSFTNEEWERLTQAMGEIHEWPITINEAHGLSISQIVRRARRHHRKHGTKEIIIDYLQLIRGNPNAQRKDLEIGEITRALKTLAVELSVPVVLLSQLNRKLEERPNKRPKLSDLRESGAIEQDSDQVLFIYRDEVYHPDTPDKGIAEINVAKHRNGPTGMIKVAWIGWRCAFEDLAS